MTRQDQEYIAYYRTMVTIRQFETLAGELFADGKIPGFIHLSIGQEASAVGVCSCLRDDDYLTTTHRGHGHMIAKGATDFPSKCAKPIRWRFAFSVTAPPIVDRCTR